ncbi:MAG: hypothetical protein HC918_05840 [Oscillatoriales cyanobacterium SM2_1_8]|nr:hypothetical protein [Oscillatoriales cyanobacterium SM2_1_8]
MWLAYGIAWQGTPLPDRPGILGHPLAWVVVNDLAVLVEPGFEEQTLAGWGEPRWLEAALTHAAVVQTVFATATILPIALRSGFFAEVAPIYALLQGQGAQWAERLRDLAGYGETTVRVVPGEVGAEELAGRAYFAAKRARWQSLETLQQTLIANSLAHRVGPVRDGEVLRMDLLLTMAQWSALRAQWAEGAGWRVAIGDWLPPYTFAGDGVTPNG